MNAEKYNKEYFEGKSYRIYTFETQRAWTETLASALSKTVKPTKVLDVGCAKGYLVHSFDKLGIEAYGVDVSSYAISSSPSNVRDRLFTVNVENEPLPFPDKCFDLVCMLATIEHLRYLDGPLKEIRRVLKPNGFFFVTVATKKTKRDKEIGHISVYPMEVWMELFKKHGFSMDRATHQLLKDQFIKMKRDFISKRKKDLQVSPPSSKTGILLNKFGIIGKFVRANLGA